ncbi:MAG: hypothetical protein P1V36_14715, partial [Planctomycetota bacterium]|nr:hypothetical protein [Planctomycetota bacterium]
MRDKLGRGLMPQLRAWQKATGNRHLLNPLKAKSEFNEMVLRELELGRDATQSGPGAAGDAIRAATAEMREWGDEWVDIMVDSKLIEPDAGKAMKEHGNYFSRQIEGRRVNELEAQFPQNNVGKRIFNEVIANANRVRLGISKADYEFGRGVYATLTPNYR